MNTDDELARDAARYRWLRKQGCAFSEQAEAWDSPGALDAAIDREMAFDAMSPDERAAEIARRYGWNK